MRTTALRMRAGGNGLADVLFGKGRGALLALLYGHPDQSYYYRQITRQLSGISAGSLQRELDTLSHWDWSSAPPWGSKSSGQPESSCVPRAARLGGEDRRGASYPAPGPGARARPEGCQRRRSLRGLTLRSGLQRGSDLGQHCAAGIGAIVRPSKLGTTSRPLNLSN